MKYRLYDIDVVINKTVVYVTLAAFITLVYVAIVVGLGGLIGAANESLGLSIVATAIVAVAFQPVRERVQRVREPVRLRRAGDAVRGAREVQRARRGTRTPRRTSCRGPPA